MKTLICLLLLALCSRGHAALRAGDFEQWNLLAVQDEGRRKPLDTFAREALLRLTGGGFLGRATYRDTAGRVWEPDDFLLSVLLDESRDWTKEPLVLINYRPLTRSLGLDPERKRFSAQELSQVPALERIGREVHALRLRTSDPVLSREQQEAETVLTRLALLRQLLSGGRMLIVPPPPDGGTGTAAAARTTWLAPPEASQAYGETAFAPVTAGLQGVAKAYLAGDGFNLGLHARELRGALRALNPARYPADADLSRELFSNHLGAFGSASLLYAAGFVLLVAGGTTSQMPLRRSLRAGGIAIALAGLLLHGLGIGLRCAVAGRPPVTNMYESMIWVAFVVTALGCVFCARYRTTTYLLAALPVGTLVLLLVQQIPVAVPGSIEPLQPVLRDNFWLSTHVLTETASYGAFALAMGFGHLLLARYIRDPLAARREHALHFWLYRVLQLGVLLLAVGTILGAVWANYSWGRYWGWDPKETWAFITFLCYIVAIHGRIAGWWGQFGLAVASVGGFAAVVMAWYGVNFWLGKGLHSYGRGVGGEGYVLAFLLLDALFLATACWRQHQGSRGEVPVLLPAATPAVS